MYCALTRISLLNLFLLGHIDIRCVTVRHRLISISRDIHKIIMQHIIHDQLKLFSEFLVRTRQNGSLYCFCCKSSISITVSITMITLIYCMHGSYRKICDGWADEISFRFQRYFLLVIFLSSSRLIPRKHFYHLSKLVFSTRWFITITPTILIFDKNTIDIYMHIIFLIYIIALIFTNVYKF